MHSIHLKASSLSKAENKEGALQGLARSLELDVNCLTLIAIENLGRREVAVSVQIEEMREVLEVRKKIQSLPGVSEVTLTASYREPINTEI